MKTKQEIKEAVYNLETKPENTGWGCGRYNVSDFITALKWVLDEDEKTKVPEE